MSRFPHILSAAQFDNEFIELIESNLSCYQNFVRSRKISGRRNLGTLNGHRICILFAQPSLRTRTTFQFAGELLGADVTFFDQISDTLSLKKQESFEHTARSLASWGTNVLVLRHSQVGIPFRMAQVEACSVINAGDGGRGGEHPTQALIDALTIKKEFGAFENVKIVFSGDMTARTARSLIMLLAKLGVKKMYFVAPEALSLELPIAQYIEKLGVPYEKYLCLKDVVSKHDIDVIYMLRTQKENLASGTKDPIKILRESCDIEDVLSDARRTYLSPEVIDILPKHVRVMHPMPIDQEEQEIPHSFDYNSRALYFKQSENGLYVRMALLELLCKRPSSIPQIV